MVVLVYCHIHHTGVFSVTPSEAVYEAVLGSRIELRCTVDADTPAVTLIWRRVINGQPSPDPYLIQPSSDPKFGIIEKNVQVEDNGVWSCYASDTFGGLDGQFAVVVLGKYNVLSMARPNS